MSHLKDGVELAPVPRLLLKPEEAAHALGMSLTFFNENVAPDLPAVRINSKVLYPVAGLDRWVEENARKVDE